MLDVVGGALMLVVGIVVLFLSISRMPKRERPPKIVKPPPLPLTLDALDAAFVVRTLGRLGLDLEPVKPVGRPPGGRR